MMTNSSLVTPLDTRSFGEKLAELGFHAAVSVVGIVGNILVLWAITVIRNLRTTSNGFIFNLAIADLFVCVLVNPMLISARSTRAWLLGDAMCVIQGVINFICLYASLFFLAAIAINRLIKTWSLKYYPVIYTKRNTGIIFGVIWLVSIVFSILPAIGWGQYAFDNVRDNCIFDRRAAPSYSIFLASVGILIPLTVCAVSYVMILIYFIKSRARVRDLGNASITDNHSCSEIRLTRNLFIVWLVFFICWAPMITMLFADPRGLMRREVYVACVWFMLCNSCLNPIIYGLINKRFREGYKTVFLRCVKRSDPSNTSVNLQGQGATSQKDKRETSNRGSSSERTQMTGLFTSRPPRV